VLCEHAQYFEFLHQSESDPAVWFSSYVARVDETVLAGMTCWDQDFDQYFEKLSDAQLGPIFADEYRKIWPTFFRLLDNTAEGQFGDGAIDQLVDPDDKNAKWFIAVLFNWAGMSDEEGNRRLTEAADSAVSLSLQVVRESQTNVSWRQRAKMGARGAAAGYRHGKEITNPWEERLGWLQAMLGG
jgi:hypothetical protein